MNFTRIANYCFKLWAAYRKVCLTFDGSGDIDYLRRVVRRLCRHGLLRLLLAAIVTRDIARLRRILRLGSRYRIRISFTATNTVRIRFFRCCEEFAVLRIRVTFPSTRPGC
jgi:hypothetical protein